MTNHITINIHLINGTIKTFNVKDMKNAVDLIKAARSDDDIIKVKGQGMCWVNSAHILFIDIIGNQ